MVQVRYMTRRGKRRTRREMQTALKSCQLLRPTLSLFLISEEV